MDHQIIPNPDNFNQLLALIEDAHVRAMKAVNAEMIRLYWNVGNYLSELCAASKFGDKVIDEVASFIAAQAPNIKGFNRRGLYRMKQFYETYKDDEFVSPLVTQIIWSNHLQIMSGSKSAEERHFYLSLRAKERYSKLRTRREKTM